MASERMRYIRRRISEMNAVRTDIEMTPLKQEIEAVFSPRNLGMDCSMLDDLLTPYARKVKAMLDQGDTSEAIIMFLEILESLSYHFVKDEHFNYFDDMYCPDYTCNDMMRNIIEKAKAKGVNLVLGTDCQDGSIRRLWLSLLHIPLGAGKAIE